MRQVPLWYAVVSPIVAIVLMAVTGFLYVGHELRKSDQRWCALLNRLDSNFKENPPSQQSGIGMADDISELRQQFGCNN